MNWQMQITDKVLMVRPVAFGYNAETAQNNFFQKESKLSQGELQKKALQEFDTMVDILRKNEIDVLVIEDTLEPAKPDAIFPNNWISTGCNNVLNVFPMCAKSRREEKRDDIVKQLVDQYEVKDFLDWSEYEVENMFLEGTGSMVMDHENKIIYACLSARTHKSLVEKFAATHGYRTITFNAVDEDGNEIYHTNVMMCIGEGFAVLCPKAITDDVERVAVAQLLETTEHENIYITHEQMNAFAGNMLHVKNKEDKKFIVLSKTAHSALNEDQKQRLQRYGKLLSIDVSTIEEVEGGSVRCMMAEIFFKEKNP